MANKNLHAAKNAKNDEFYTQLSDIENELKHYREHFKAATVFLNCDDPEESMFWKYFELNFDFLGLDRLISTHYDRTEPTYMLEIKRGQDLNGDGEYDGKDIVKTPLKQNGDFRSEECIELLKEADIVVTNPPFSLFREYVAQLMEYDKKFLVIGSMNAITYKEIFPLIKNDELWLGINSPKEFLQPDNTYKKFGNIKWFTNLNNPNRHENIILFKKYNPDNYPKYDNYDAIECGKVVDIPMDYEESWGIPNYIQLDETKWHFLYEGLDENNEKRNWIIPASGTAIRQIFDSKEEGYIELITKAIEEDITHTHTHTHTHTQLIIYRNGIIGIPITLLDKYNPTQFKILGITDRQNTSGLRTKKYTAKDSSRYNDLNARSVLRMSDGNYKQVYARILIVKQSFIEAV